MSKMISNNNSKSRSTRKPLMDVSNGCSRSLKPTIKKKTLIAEVEEEKEEIGGVGDVLDRILLAHSDLSSIIRQVDELVVQAVQSEVTSKKGRKEVESFLKVLADMQSYLKPWVLRFQKSLSIPLSEAKIQLAYSTSSKAVSKATEEVSNVAESPEQLQLDSLISPSPLVTWCRDRTVESGRQLFLLTPLPNSTKKTSKLRGKSRPVLEKKLESTPRNIVGDLLDGLKTKLPASTLSDSVISSPPKVFNRNLSTVFTTSCLKVSPPKSCVLLEPISESSHQNCNQFRKATPFHFGTQNWTPCSSEPSSSHVSENLTLKYPELFQLEQPYKSGFAKKEIEVSFNWLSSPPKSCVLMEPPNEKLLIPPSTTKKDNDVQGTRKLTNKTHVKVPIGTAILESTPLRRECESTIHKGKRPGENTLKRELWTRFEAATSNVFRLDVSAFQESATKGFLDRLEESSYEETSAKPEGLR
ncbi:hypothetical protein GIB67_010223 [Kingdonia uniflora]|uniref:Uncharacterized protein n=1 Tax=Kingdonia uniflora TaxID=39325 RepID=A0A7J7NAY6_9MAGN|nr:hypothetical protein GIB67_010223 [Kingdonia uniflora]